MHIHKTYLKGDVRVLFKEHFQLTDANSQVTISEFVGNIEPQSAKFPPLQSYSMEQAER